MWVLAVLSDSWHTLIRRFLHLSCKSDDGAAGGDKKKQKKHFLDVGNNAVKVNNQSNNLIWFMTWIGVKTNVGRYIRRDTLSCLQSVTVLWMLQEPSKPNPSGIMLLTQAPGYTAGYLGCGTAYKNSTGTNLYWDYIAYKVRIKLNSLSYKHKELVWRKAGASTT